MQSTTIALLTALASLASARYCARTCDWTYIAAKYEGKIEAPCVDLGAHNHPRPATECHYRYNDYTGATILNSCCKLNFGNWPALNDKWWCEEIVPAQVDPYLPEAQHDPHRKIPQCEVERLTGKPFNYGGHLLDAPSN